MCVSYGINFFSWSRSRSRWLASYRWMTLQPPLCHSLRVQRAWHSMACGSMVCLHALHGCLGWVSYCNAHISDTLSANPFPESFFFPRSKRVFHTLDSSASSISTFLLLLLLNLKLFFPSAECSGWDDSLNSCLCWAGTKDPTLLSSVQKIQLYFCGGLYSLY